MKRSVKQESGVGGQGSARRETERQRDRRIERRGFLPSLILSFSPSLRLARCLTPRRPRNYWGHTDRKGSVLLVVIGLLLLLMLVGFTFFTFASQEHVTSEYYADSMKIFDDSGIDTEVLLDFGIRQLIVGPNDNEYQSALALGRHSLVPNAIGMHDSSPTNGTPVVHDRRPFNGTGINLISGPQGQVFVDQNFDGLADSAPANVAQLLEINHGQLGYNRQQFLNPISPVPPFPAIDVGYTYPDINNVFLAYIGKEPSNPSLSVITPSFHRPVLLRDSGGAPIPNWYQNPATVTRVLRPHPDHIVLGTSVKRFLSSSVNVGAQTIQPFPFAVDKGGNSTFGEQGLWSNSGAQHDYDADNDGDGTYEGVLLDLGFPMLTLPDGRKYVVLFSMTVLDADGLINLNQAGNIAGFANFNQPFGGTQPISRSNLGQSPAEINPWWALIADPQNSLFLNPPNGPGSPTAELQAYRAFFGLSNTNPAQYQINRLAMGNMDLWFLLNGRTKYDVSFSGANEVFTLKDLVEGRWGEGSALLQGAQSGNPLSFPRPGVPNGVPNSDDDTDAAEGTSNETDSILGTDPVVIRIPPIRHPTDFDGSGIAVANGTNGLTAAVAAPPGPPTPVRWRQYTNYQAAGSYQNVAGGAMMNSPNANGLLDATYRDVDETVTDRRYSNPSLQDQIYGPEEIAALHLSASDYKSSVGSSRLRQVMPFNFELNLQAAAIRKLFTTESWDRREHGFRYSPARPWEFNADLNGNYVDTNGDGRVNYPDRGLEFPPIAINNTTLPQGGLDVGQPFRSEVRAAIGMEFGNATNVTWPQWRLNINRFLTSKFAVNNQVNPYPSPQYQGVHQFGAIGPAPNYLPVNPLQYRHLTPHPTDPGSTPVPGSPGGSSPPVTFNPGAGAAFQEYWARRDRQQMARDIYVMLYMFGGGLVREVDLNNNGMVEPEEDLNGNGIRDSFVDYSAVSNRANAGKRALYADWQLQEMAQFAVNYVDALDRDDTITMFEFDRNLADGWNLDDNPYTTNDPATTNNDRGVVFGLEAQQLAINEALVIASMKVPTFPPTAGGSNHPATQFDDSQQDRFYAYVELQNVSPYNVPVGSTGTPGTLGDGVWQIAVEDKTTIGNDRRLTLFDAGNFVPAGGLYTIGSRTYVSGGTDDASPGTPFPSLFRVDPTWDPANPTSVNLVQIAPAAPLALDLVHNSGNLRYSLTDTSGTNVSKGAFVPGVIDLTAATFPYNIHFVLRRRLHLTRSASAPEADNPWIEVDRFQVQLRLANPDPAGDAAPSKPQIYTFRLRNQSDPVLAGNPALLDIQPKLAKLRSVERIQPLARFDWDLHSAGLVANTIGQTNQQSGNLLATTPDQIVSQPQFDRDFTSVADLLSIPLYGPTQLVDKLSFSRRLVSEVVAPSANPILFEPRTGQSKFLRPDFPDTVAPIGPALSVLSPQVTFTQQGNQWIASVDRPADIVTPPANVSYDIANPVGIDLYDQWRLDNRWHRVLELLEVPSRANMQVEKYLQSLYAGQPYAGQFGLQTRRPGRINLNGLRDAEVFRALLDDPYSFNISTGADLLEGPRNWWFQFMTARDGFDPRTQLFLPGSAVSRPFRDLSTVDGPIATLANTVGVPPIEQTLLRRLMLDNEDLNANTTREPGEDWNGNLTLDPANTNGTRRLLEARTSSDLPLPALPNPTSNLVDYQTRHRLLAKVANNSTNRSNVFVVWMTVAFFDAYQPDAVGQPNVVQIGGEMTDQPRRRGFFVIDRSLLDDAYNPQTKSFDYTKFIQYRKTLK